MYLGVQINPNRRLRGRNPLRVFLPLALPAVALLAGCAGHDHPKEDFTGRVKTVNAETIRSWMAEERDFTIVDVRSEGEYDSDGHAPEARLHPWSIFNRNPERNQAFLAEMTTEFEPDDTIVLLCSHAMRASQAPAALQEKRGFTAVYVFPGGYEGHHMDGYPAGDGWKAAGLPFDEW
jgi:rhodanese-related sulfurtransferase